MVRELSKHQGAFLFDCCVFIARFASSSCYSSAKTRIRPVKSYHNHIACTALDGKIPLLALTGITPDISIILLFTFYQPVLYATYDQHFPSESEERAGYWVGFGEHNRILSKDQILVSCSHMTCYLQKIHYTSIYIFYLIFISKHFQISKNDANPTSTSEVTSKTIFYYFI